MAMATVQVPNIFRMETGKAALEAFDTVETLLSDELIGFHYAPTICQKK